MHSFVYYIGYYFHVNQVSDRLASELRLSGALVILLVLEVAYAGWKKSTLGILTHPSRTDWWDIASLFIYNLNARRVLANIFVFGFLAYLFELAEPYHFSLLQDWPPILSIPIAFVFQDFLLYWSHRWKHEIPMLWWSHEMHHASTRVTVATSYRIHPLDQVVSWVIVYFPMQTIFGWGVINHLAFALLPAFSGKFNHSRIDTDLGWFGKWLLVSPRYHHQHHSRNPEHFNKNYGETFRFWDKLFGTEFGECDSISDVQPGLPDNPYEEKGIFRPFLRPVWQFYVVPVRAALKYVTSKGHL